MWRYFDSQILKKRRFFQKTDNIWIHNFIQVTNEEPVAVEITQVRSLQIYAPSTRTRNSLISRVCTLPYIKKSSLAYQQCNSFKTKICRSVSTLTKHRTRASFLSLNRQNCAKMNLVRILDLTKMCMNYYKRSVTRLAKSMGLEIS